MTMIAGTVTVAEDGTVTDVANSLSKALFDVAVANYAANNGVPLPNDDIGAAIKMNYANHWSDFAAAFVPWLIANADLVISVAGLQRDPVGPNDPTLAPSSPVTITAPLQ